VKIGVSGASGHLGRAVVSELLRRSDGHEVVAITRTPETVSGPAQGRFGDYNRPESLAQAYAGLDRLQNCRNSMRPQAKVLAVECVVPESGEPSFSKLLDLNMMVMTGGRERTEREFRELFGSSGLSITKVVSTASPLQIIEAIRN